MENGGIRDEAWLQKKLNYIDKTTYKGIYSFDVLGLQNINRNMDENQLQEYLLQAGALGSTQFTTMRTQLDERKMNSINVLVRIRLSISKSNN